MPKFLVAVEDNQALSSILNASSLDWMVGIVMESLGYEIVYVDKFKDVASADIARNALKQRFHLTDYIVERLSSGMPVVIKKEVELDEAKRYLQAITEVGGVCWVQKMTPDGAHHERRLFGRRLTKSRRNGERGSSIIPDRRFKNAEKGRRSSDIKH